MLKKIKKSDIIVLLRPSMKWKSQLLVVHILSFVSIKLQPIH